MAIRLRRIMGPHRLQVIERFRIAFERTSPLSWRKWTDWAKKSDRMLRVADRLGRGRGRVRFFDDLQPPHKPNRTPDLTKWGESELSAVWIGHATILLRVGGMNILTDPVMSSRVGVGFGLITAGPKRLVAPALSLRQLPKIDLVLLSHAHFDHLDRPTLCKLDRHIPLITAHQTADLVKDLGFRDVTELGWGDSHTVSGVKFTARQVNHWGARTFLDQYRGYNAYLIESARHRVLYCGDTAYHNGFKDIGKVDLAIIGIGAYNPYEAAHATPEQAWRMANHVEATHILPMHHSTFKLSHEAVEEPMERMLEIAGNQRHRIAVHEIGGQWASE